MLQHISEAVASSGTPFLDLAANQVEFANALKNATSPAFAALGLELISVTMQNVSLPEELQKILDQRIGMGIIGQNMGQFMQYQAAQTLPELAKNAGGGSGIAGEAVGLGAGVALGQTLAQTLGQAWRAWAPRRRHRRSASPTTSWHCWRRSATSRPRAS